MTKQITLNGETREVTLVRADGHWRATVEVTFRTADGKTFRDRPAAFNLNKRWTFLPITLKSNKLANPMTW